MLALAPLVVTGEQITAFVSAIHRVVDLAQSSNIRSEALGWHEGRSNI
jgi:hypothetical protein